MTRDGVTGRVPRLYRARWRAAHLAMAGASVAVAAMVIGAGGAAARGRFSLPNPSATNNTLNGVSCVSASHCWAAGFYYGSNGSALNQLLRWDGANWTLVGAPNPGGTGKNGLNELNGIACVSRSNCWAVGLTKNKAGATLNEALHWTKGQWSLAKVPNPAGTSAKADNVLEAVACVTSSDCWAAGTFGMQGRAAKNETLHWNGKRWSSVPAPNPAGTARHDGNRLYAVACASKSDCWAGGYLIEKDGALLNETLHWNGKKWSSAQTPNPGGAGAGDKNFIYAMTCASSSNCWATGTYNNGLAYLNQALRWNGKKWSIAQTPNPSGTGANDDSELYGIDCVSASDCWAGGYYYDTTATPDGAYVNEALHWDGAHWSMVSTPNPGGAASDDFNSIDGISCIATSDCWAVGYVETGNSGPYLNEALHWDGMNWSAG